MSPEAIMGKEVDARADVYAMGIMTYEMLSGVVPYEADSAMQLLLKHLHDEPVPLFETNPNISLPRSVHRFVWRCLSKDREKRPVDARAFREQLREAMARADDSDAELMSPVITTSEGFRVSKEVLDAIATDRKLKRPPVDSSGELGDTRMRSSEVIVTDSSPWPWLVAGAAVLLAAAVVLAVLLRSPERPEAILGAGAQGTDEVGALASGAGRGAEATGGEAEAVAAAPDASAPDAGPTAARASDADAPKAEAVETVTLTLITIPHGAEVRAGDEVLGKTPWMQRVPRADTPMAFMMSLKGYDPLKIDVLPDQDRLEKRELKKRRVKRVVKPRPPKSVTPRPKPRPKPKPKPAEASDLVDDLM